MNQQAPEIEKTQSVNWLWFLVFAYMGIDTLFNYFEREQTLRNLAQLLFFGGAALTHFPKGGSETRSKLQKMGFAIAFLGVILGLWYHVGNSLG